MFERLIDLLIDFIDLFRIWEVVRTYEEGVVLRFGKYHRNIGPGLNWKLPFAIEEVITDSVVIQTRKFQVQSVTTKDGRPVVISCICSYKIHDIKKYLLEVEDADDVLVDSAYGEIGTHIRLNDWETVHSTDICEEVYKDVRRRAFKWGIELVSLQICDFSTAKSLHLFEG